MHVTEPQSKPAIKVAPFSFVTVAFGPPGNPLKTRAAIHHAVHWNKLREMMRPFGFEEVQGSAVILGNGDGSVITFRTRGAPKLPQPVQDWLEAVEPKGFEVAKKIAAVAAGVLDVIGRMFGVRVLSDIAAGSRLVLDAVEEAAEAD